jgi:predicted glycosyltransferase
MPIANTLEKNAAVSRGDASPRVGAVLSHRKVWIDLENSPHIPFFLPIIRELERRGCEVILTARDCFQVCELADIAGLNYRKVGHHYGKHSIAKLVGLGIRSLQLAPLILRKKPEISVSHGSRSLIVLSAMLGIRNITILDYEYADFRLTGWLGAARKTWIMTPEVIPSDRFIANGIQSDHVLQYPGIKEDVYVPSFLPDYSLRESLGLTEDEIIVVIRPPATEAHYHNPESEKLLMTVLDVLAGVSGARAILLPRTPKQEIELRSARPELFAAGKIIVPKHAVNGLALIWYSDLVISGGGTMNREAAALGIPVYSLFRGKLGAVDRHLAKTGKLMLLETEQDVREKLRLVRRDRNRVFRPEQEAALPAVVEHICAVLEARG